MQNTEKLLTNEDFSVAVMPGVSAIVSTEVQVPRTTVGVNKLASEKEWLIWGDNNDFPQLVIADVRKDPEIGTLLNKQAGLLYSGGLEWGILKKENGKEFLTPLPADMEAKVVLWLKRTNINRYLLESSKDITWFYNGFIEVVLSADRSEIVQICTQAAEECRLGPQNKTTGLIDLLYINANLPNAKPTDKDTKVLPYLDTYYNPAEQLRQGNKLNYIYHISHANPGNKFYQLADWNSIRESGWLEVSQEIPKFKKALLKNQITLKYHIKISSMYWDKKFPGWDKMSDPAKKAVKEAELLSIQETLAGADKAGKSFTSVIHHDFNSGKAFPLIEIEAIDDKIKTGQYLEEGKEASLYKMAAIGLHPALVGTMPNNGMAGAGSNIREAYNLFVMENKPNQDLILEVLNNLVVEYNGWDPLMIFRFKNQFMTTLDSGAETKTIK